MTSRYKPKIVNSWFALLLLCFGLTLLDIAVVESYYRPLQAWDSIFIWHTIYRTIFMITPLIASYLFRHLAPLATWFFFFFGLEDTLFYALQGYLPVYYPGVHIMWFWEPSLSLVMQLNLVGLLFILIFGIFASKKSTSLFYRLETLVNRVQQPITASLKQEEPEKATH